MTLEDFSAYVTTYKSDLDNHPRVIEWTQQRTAANRAWKPDMTRIDSLDHLSKFYPSWSDFLDNYDECMQYLMTFHHVKTFDEFEFEVRRALLTIVTGEGITSMEASVAAAAVDTEQGLGRDDERHDTSRLPGLTPKAMARRKPSYHQYSRMIGQLKMRTANNKRRGKANSTDKLHSEMSIPDYFDHAARSKVVAENREFDDIQHVPP